MTREQFLSAHRHMLGGLLMDGVIRGQQNGSMVKFMEIMYAQIDSLLNTLYESAHPKKPPTQGEIQPQKKEAQK